MDNWKTVIKRVPNSEEIALAVKNNDGYCPCRRERTADTKCICKAFREQKEGMCHCGLFIKELKQAPN